MAEWTLVRSAKTRKAEQPGAERFRVRLGWDASCERVCRVRHAYNALTLESKSERPRARNIELRRAFNLVKALLYERLTAEGDRCVDLGCGHGHDVLKWAFGRPRCVVFADVSATALAEAERRWRDAGCPYAAAFCELDFTDASTPRRLCAADLRCGGPVEGGIGLVSCHNALQYAPARPGGLESALRLVSCFLRPGGVLVGSVPDAEAMRSALVDGRGAFGRVRVSFAAGTDARAPLATGTPYVYAGDGVRREQFVVDFRHLVEVARRQGLALQFEENCADWYLAESRNPTNAAVQHRFCRGADPSPAVVDSLRLYRAFAFRRGPSAAE